MRVKRDHKIKTPVGAGKKNIEEQTFANPKYATPRYTKMTEDEFLAALEAEYRPNHLDFQLRRYEINGSCADDPFFHQPYSQSALFVEAPCGN